MKIEPFFRWYDLWVGVYIDIDNVVLYICPLPMLGVKVSFGVWEEIGYALSTLNAFPWLSETWTDTEIIYKLENVSWDGVWWTVWVKTGPLPHILGKVA